MRLLMTFEVTWRTLGQVLLLLAQFAAVVTVVYFVLGPAAALILGVLLVWALWTVATLGRSR